jgi:hypothetical protein
MPQLDKVTFFSQAVAVVIVFSFIFLFSITFILPRLYSIKKTRWFLQQKNSNEKIPEFLSIIYSTKLANIVGSLDALNLALSDMVTETETSLDMFFITELNCEDEEQMIAELFFEFVVAETLLFEQDELNSEAAGDDEDFDFNDLLLNTDSSDDDAILSGDILIDGRND